MNQSVLFEGAGSHGHYYVVERTYDDRPSRLLLSGRAAPQSGLALDDGPELLFDYNQRLLEVAMSLDPASVLVIGGGAFTLPKALIERFSDMRVDVVEIDTLLPELARTHFALPNDPRLTIVNRDGREYINNHDGHYDLIIVDAFSEYDIPHSLISSQAAAQYARLLTPGGTLVFNIISTYYGRPSLAHQMLATFDHHFVSTELYPADPRDDKRTEQNLLFIASLSVMPHLDYLQSYCVHPNIPPTDDMQILDNSAPYVAPPIIDLSS